jgi:hypothetical protein
MLLWEWSFGEPNVEARPALNRPELDNSRRRSIDHIDQRTQRFPFPATVRKSFRVSPFPVVGRRYRDDEPLRLHAARHVRLERLLNGGGSGWHRW